MAFRHSLVLITKHPRHLTTHFSSSLQESMQVGAIPMLKFPDTAKSSTETSPKVGGFSMLQLPPTGASTLTVPAADIQLCGADTEGTTHDAAVLPMSSLNAAVCCPTL
jgi:hypothetical protein